MHKHIFTICMAILFFGGKPAAQPKTDSLLKDILSRQNNDAINKVLAAPGTYRYQVIYTQINRDSHNRPVFRNYYYNVDPDLYFNPASTVKLPLALLSLEKFHRLRVPNVTRYTPVQFDSSYPGQVPAYHDSTAENGYPSIAHYIRKALLISDNDAYNRFYQFVGQRDVNRFLHEKGYADIRITRQFMSLNEDQNRHTNQVRFINTAGKTLYTQPPAYNTDSFDYRHVVKMGRGYMNRDDSLINEPIDFTKHNNISLEDLQQVLQSALFPESVPAGKRFNLDDDDRSFLYRYLSQFPSETSFPKYDTAKYYDSYVKFLMRDSTHHLPPQVRVFNKVGWAYGFLTDVSYIVDFRNNIEFMLAATIYVNSDGILNDNKYDYDAIGYPFLYNLGQTIYQYEIKRQRLVRPDLSRFKIRYDHRDPRDNRPSISDAAN
jgi:hypothetical protein